jgi:hypothetical protein
MNGHTRLLTRTSIVLVVAVVLSVGHIALPYLVAHAALSATVVSVVIVVVAVIHFGLLGTLVGSLRAHFRRR